MAIHKGEIAYYIRN